jgi:outer membrane protein OmpA-like peptidoglycan-associated protein
LSQDRAEAVRQYLVGKGVPADRLIAAGYGEAQPISTNRTPEGRERNRRVEFVLVDRAAPGGTP